MPFTMARRKYGNVPTEYNGRKFASKLEADRAATLDNQIRAGMIKSWFPQVSIPVPGETDERMVIDFMLIGNDGAVTWEDTKGAPPTRTWLRKAAVLAKYGIDIRVIGPAGKSRYWRLDEVDHAIVRQSAAPATKA